MCINLGGGLLLFHILVYFGVVLVREKKDRDGQIRTAKEKLKASSLITSIKNKNKKCSKHGTTIAETRNKFHIGDFGPCRHIWREPACKTQLSTRTSFYLWAQHFILSGQSVSLPLLNILLYKVLLKHTEQCLFLFTEGFAFLTFSGTANQIAFTYPPKFAKGKPPWEPTKTKHGEGKVTYSFSAIEINPLGKVKREQS